MSLTRVACLALTITAVFPGSAGASSLLETLGAFSDSHGGLARVQPSGVSAVYFNPALLLGQPAQQQVGFLVFGQALHVALQARPIGIDVAESILRARKWNPDGTTSRMDIRPLPTSHLRNPRGAFDSSGTSSYVEIGTLVPIGESQRVALGFYAVIPTGDFQAQSPFFSDEREQYFSNSLHFELYEDRMMGSVFCLAVAGRPLDWLSVGLGVLLANSTQAIAEIYVPDATDQEDARTNSKLSVRSRLIPHLGLAIEPNERLRLTATAHFPIHNEVNGQGQLQFWDYDYPDGKNALYQPFAFAHGDLPWRLSLGASYALGDRQSSLWTLAGSVQWTEWSAYLDRHQEHPLDRWSNTFSAAVGGGWQAGSHSASVQLGFVPSPVPDQTGRSNTVDNDRLQFGAGYEWRFRAGQAELGVGVQLQLQHLFYRHVTKDPSAAHPVMDEYPDAVDVKTNEFIPESAGFQTNNPGYPGFSSDGWLWAGGVSVRYYR